MIMNLKLIAVNFNMRRQFLSVTKAYAGIEFQIPQLGVEPSLRLSLNYERLVKGKVIKLGSCCISSR